jgi:serine/threonine protein kinase
MTKRSPPYAIFFAALEKATAAERAAYLDEACAGDDDLRRRVERLLAAQPQVGGFLERPVVEAADLAALAPPVTPERDAASDSGAAPTERLEAGETLEFLAPSQRPGSLGRLGHYEVLQVVGKGGMGVVLRALDDKLHRVVAIKVLAPQLATSGSARQRFVREAQAAAAVSHDNVVAIHAVEDAGLLPYLVTRFIDGCTLQEKLDRTGPLPLTEILRIGLQIAAGLAAAHAQGLVHRDVKPANILLENKVERVKITDFGLARAVDDASLTQSGFIAGTPSYMSPEQANGAKVDHRSDLFSLGSVLYTLCTGHAPFRAETTMAVLQRVCNDSPRPIREVNPEIPDWLAAIIARLHAKDPAARFQSAAEVAELLGRHLAHLQQAGIEPSELRTQPSGVSGPPGKAASSARKLAAWAALIAVGCIVACWIFWSLNETKAPDETKPPDRTKTPDVTNKTTQAAPPSNARPSFLLPQPDHAHWTAQTADGRLLAVPCGRTVALFNTQSGALIRTFAGHTGQAFRGGFSPDGKWFACGSQSHAIKVWNVDTGREVRTLEGHTDQVYAVTFNADGKRLGSASKDGTVKVWDVTSQGSEPPEFQLSSTLDAHAGGAHHLAFSPDGSCLVSGGLDNLGKVWDLKTGQLTQTLEGHTDRILTIAFSRDGKVLATGSDPQVIVWDARTYQPLHTLDIPGGGVLGFTPDGKILVTAGHYPKKGDSRSFSRWDVKTGEKLATLPLPKGGGFQMGHLSTDGLTIFIAYSWPPQPRVGVYDAETGKERFPH